MDNKDTKLAALKAVMDQYNKDYVKKGGQENAKIGGAKKTLFFASEMNLVSRKLGLPEYDKMCGGEPEGRIVIDYGPTGAGKSTFNYFKIAVLQRQGKVCAVLPMEGGFDPVWAEKCGVDLSELLVIDVGETFEESISLLIKVLQASGIDHVLVDSIHGQMVNKERFQAGKGAAAKKDREFGEDTMGGLPKKVGDFLKRVTPVFGKAATTMTIIGQARDNLDYGGNIMLTGGHALKHFARRICRWTRAAKSTWPTKGDEVLGFTSRVVLELQQLNENEGQFLLVPFLKGEGVYKAQLYASSAMNVGLIKPGKGSYWTWDGEDGKPVNINGLQAVYRHFHEDPDQLQWLIDKLLVEVPEPPVEIDA